MKNLFKPEDFYYLDFDNKHKAADLANEKLNKLIEDSQTVYGYGITPTASSLWNMNGPEKERCPHTHQAKLMFIEPIAKEEKQENYIEVGEVDGEPIYKRVPK